MIHYEENEDNMLKAIQEYRRVLRPGGRFFLSTTGPEDQILEQSAILGAHRYEIGREVDFRKGEVYFYFDSSDYIKYYFSKFFSDVMVGRTRSHLMTQVVDAFVATGVKGPDSAAR